MGIEFSTVEALFCTPTSPTSNPPSPHIFPAQGERERAGDTPPRIPVTILTGFDQNKFSDSSLLINGVKRLAAQCESSQIERCIFLKLGVKPSWSVLISLPIEKQLAGLNRIRPFASAPFRRTRVPFVHKRKGEGPLTAFYSLLYSLCICAPFLKFPGDVKFYLPVTICPPPPPPPSPPYPLPIIDPSFGAARLIMTMGGLLNIKSSKLSLHKDRKNSLLDSEVLCYYNVLDSHIFFAYRLYNGHYSLCSILRNPISKQFQTRFSTYM